MEDANHGGRGERDSARSKMTGARLSPAAATYEVPQVPMTLTLLTVPLLLRPGTVALLAGASPNRTEAIRSDPHLLKVKTKSNQIASNMTKSHYPPSPHLRNPRASRKVMVGHGRLLKVNTYFGRHLKVNKVAPDAMNRSSAPAGAHGFCCNGVPGAAQAGPRLISANPSRWNVAVIVCLRFYRSVDWKVRAPIWDHRDAKNSVCCLQSGLICVNNGSFYIDE